jgi:hypothetical protein
MNELTNINQEDYGKFLQQAVAQIHTTRTLVAKQINSAVQSVYWDLGKLLFEKQLEEGYGSGVVNQLSVDLKKEFPDMGLYFYGNKSEKCMWCKKFPSRNNPKT